MTGGLPGLDDYFLKPYRSEDFEAGAPILAARYWWNKAVGLVIWF